MKTKKQQTPQTVYLLNSQKFTVSGYYETVKIGRFGKALILRTDDELFGINLTTVLISKLKHYIAGNEITKKDLIKIINLGKVNNYYNYQVFINGIEIETSGNCDINDL